MYPPDVGDYGWYGEDAALQGPALWRPSDVSGYTQRVRATISTSLFRYRIAVRVDQDASGKATGRLVQRSKVNDHWKTVDAFNFPVSAADVARLDDIFARGSFLRDPSEVWEGASQDGENDRVCIDGIEVILERATAEGYRFSTANVSCAVPREFYDYTVLLLQLAGRRAEPMLEFLGWD